MEDVVTGDRERDEELVSRTVQSQDAFAELVERYHRMVFAIALARTADRDIAEEITQETFLRAYLHLDSLRRRDQVSSWLGSIARNLAESWRIQHQTRSRLAAMVPLDVSELDVPDARGRNQRETAAAQQEARLLHEALGRLPAPQREVVLLHFLEGLTKTEIARRIGVYPSSVARQLKSGLQRLRQEMGTLLEPDRIRSVVQPPPRTASRVGLVVAALAALPPAARAQVHKASLSASGPAGTLPAGTLLQRVAESITGGGSMFGLKLLVAGTLMGSAAVGVHQLKQEVSGEAPAGRNGRRAQVSTSPGRTAVGAVGSIPSRPSESPGDHVKASRAGDAMQLADAEPVAAPEKTGAREPLADKEAGQSRPVVDEPRSSARGAAPAGTPRTTTASVALARVTPNVVEARLRALASRTKNDMRSMATAIETYYVDHNVYPLSDSNRNIRGRLPGEPPLPSFATSSLTTPIAYATSYFSDPFAPNGETFVYYGAAMPSEPDKPRGWILVSPGPDGRFDLDPTIYDPAKDQPQKALVESAWDPTNGTLSRGDIWRVKQ